MTLASVPPNCVEIHGDICYEARVEQIDTICLAFRDAVDAGATTQERNTVWNVCSQVYVLLKQTGIAVLDLQPGNATRYVLTFTRLMPNVRHLFGGGNIQVALTTEQNVGKAWSFILEDGPFYPDTVAEKLDLGAADAVVLAEWLTTLGAIGSTYVNAGSLDG